MSPNIVGAIILNDVDALKLPCYVNQLKVLLTTTDCTNCLLVAEHGRVVCQVAPISVPYGVLPVNIEDLSPEPESF